MKKLSQTSLRWLWVSVIVIILDHVAKVLVQQNLILDDYIRVTPFFNLALAHNKGAAFSFLGYASGWQVWFFGIVAIAVSSALLVWMYRIPKNIKWVPIALALIVGGALGNLWDRFSYGFVVDFIQLHIGQHYFAVFNIADSAICIGAFMLVLDAIFQKKSP